MISCLSFYFSSIVHGFIHEWFVSVVGLYTAAFDLQVEWLVVKGIANYADGSETTNENWSEFASANAASLVAKILNDAIAFKRWPHYQGSDDNVNRGRFVLNLGESEGYFFPCKIGKKKQGCWNKRMCYLLRANICKNRAKSKFRGHSPKITFAHILFIDRHK